MFSFKLDVKQNEADGESTCSLDRSLRETQCETRQRISSVYGHEVRATRLTDVIHDFFR